MKLMNKIYALRFSGNKYANWVVAAPSANAARRFIDEKFGSGEWLDINETTVQIVGVASNAFAQSVDPILIAGGA